MAKAATPSKKSLFTLEETNRRKLKSLAGIINKKQNEVINTALSEYFERYEKKNGPIPVK